MKTFEVRIRRYDRREGLSNWKVAKLDATSTATALARAVRDYMGGLTAKERRDAAKSLEVKCMYLGLVEAKASPKTYSLVRDGKAIPVIEN